jgi:UTP--glucose-1-phosphate uridylyltransferase
MATIRKAVFPAAGLGTRFLPATKAQPKEMLPLVDKPIIQYAVEESIASGIENLIIVTGRGKNSIEDHFDVAFELEKILEERGKLDLLNVVRSISGMVPISYIRQKEALGLGHAVLTARDLVYNEPFAVLLGDDVIVSDPPCIGQMMEVYDRYQASIIAIMEVPREETNRYGIIQCDSLPDSDGRCMKYGIWWKSLRLKAPLPTLQLSADTSLHRLFSMPWRKRGKEAEEKFS